MCRFLEVFFLGVENITELLGIAVDDRKPGALDVNHNPMSFLEAVAFIAEVKFDFSHQVGHERFWLFEAVSVLAADNFACQKHLEVSHSHIAGIELVVGSISGVDIDQLYDPVCICSCCGNMQTGDNGTGNGNVFSKDIGLIDQDVRTAPGKPLILDHPEMSLVSSDFRGPGDRFVGIADV